jgi:hypothetical protein
MHRFATRSFLKKTTKLTGIIRSEHAHHGPAVPPFGRQRPPTGTVFLKLLIDKNRKQGLLNGNPLNP